MFKISIDNNYLYFNENYLLKYEKHIENSLNNLQQDTLAQIIEFDSEILQKIREKTNENTCFSQNKLNFNWNKQSVSCAIIVKNEEKYIKRAIKSIKDYCDEIIIVDTGSTDKTIDIIKKMGLPKLKLYEDMWRDDFSRARNYALERVTNDWVFFIDADEYLDKNSISPEEFKKLLISLNNFPEIHKIALCPQIEDTRNNDVVIGVKRIFKVDPDTRYYGLVHEEPRVENSEMNAIAISLLIKHDGYKKEVMKKKDKINRNFNLLKKMIKLESNNKRWTYFYLRDGFSMIEPEELIETLNLNIKVNVNKSLNKHNLQLDDYTFAFLDMLAQLYMASNQKELFLATIKCMDFIMPGNSNSVYYYNMYHISRIQKEYQNMLQDVLKYRSNNFDPEYGTINSNRSHIDFLLGILLFETGNYQNAFEYFDNSKETFNVPEILEYYEGVKKIVPKTKN